jgi:hypothetical protein
MCAEVHACGQCPVGGAKSAVFQESARYLDEHRVDLLLGDAAFPAAPAETASGAAVLELAQDRASSPD